MKAKLITFGDSWPNGVELKSNERPFGYILADLLKVNEYENLAVSGSSLNSTIYYLNKYIKHNEKNKDCLTIAVFHFPSISRMMFLNFDGEPVSYKVPPSINHFSVDPGHIWYKYFHNDAQDMFFAQTSIVTLQSMCKFFDIQDFYMTTSSSIDLNFPGIDASRIYPQTALELFGVSENSLEISHHHNNEYIYPNISHPNQKGHELIANTLYDWIRKHLDV